MSALLVEGSLLDIFLKEAQFGLVQGALETAEALLRVRQMQRARDGCKPGVPKLKQAAGCVVGSLFIVGSHAIAAPVLRKPVDADHTRSGSTVRFRLRRKVTEVGRDHDEAGWQISAQFIQVYQLLGMVVVCIAEDQTIAIV